MKPNYPIVGLVILIFMVIAVLTNILGPIVPAVIDTFKLSQFMVSFLPMSFFLAYGVASIPSGMMIERFREKAVITAAFALALFGSLMFGLLPVYGVSLPSLFSIGIGMAMLQVAINPLLRVAGGEQNFSFFSVLAQALFGLASWQAPKLYGHLVESLKDRKDLGGVASLLARVVPEGMSWVSLYWVFAAITTAMIALVLVVRLPKVDRKDDERAGTWATHVELFRDPVVLRFMLGIFCYVGTEQGISVWISQFLKTQHGLDPVTVGGAVSGDFWLFMTAGCVLGLVLLKLLDQRKVLVGAALLAMATLLLALYGSADTSRIAFRMCGFFLSVMWSIVFSLGMNSISKHHGSLAGILCTGIAGGGIVPLIIGWLADQFGLRQGMLFIFLPLGYIMSIGFWAKPLVNNATIFSAKKEAATKQAAVG
jgi:FHS family L-fucose permease-like MFS transporter